MRKAINILPYILLAFASSSQAIENRFQQFTADTDQAYAVYRSALFQTNMNNMAKSGQANQQFINQWQQIKQKYSNQPPEIYSSDPLWKETLANIETIALASNQQITAGHLSKAHETLEVIRDELSKLRQRNSVIVFSDHINNYHEQMEGVLERASSMAKMDLIEISGYLAVLKYLAHEIKDNAPRKYQRLDKYNILLDSLFRSLQGVTQAVQSGDPETINKSIKMLKPAYAKLFVNFG